MNRRPSQSSKPGVWRWVRRIAVICAVLVALPVVWVAGMLGLQAYWNAQAERHSERAASARCDAFKGAYRDGTLMGAFPPRARRPAHRPPSTSAEMTGQAGHERDRILSEVGLVGAMPQLFETYQYRSFGYSYDQAAMANRDGQGWVVTALYSNQQHPERNWVGPATRLPSEASLQLDQLAAAECLYAEPQDVSDPIFPADAGHTICLDGATSFLMIEQGRRFGVRDSCATYGMAGGVVRLLRATAKAEHDRHVAMIR